MDEREGRSGISTTISHPNGKRKKKKTTTRRRRRRSHSTKFGIK